jgi:hypothetical protein
LSRNNLGRTGARQDESTPSQPTEQAQSNALHFVTPTEFVDLPSQGLGYEEGHPLHGKDTIEIRYMTAKDEDILSSRTLLKKGLAIERFLDNIIVDKGIKAGSLLTGDRNAITIAARISGYGAEYDTHINCPSCMEKAPLSFDLGKQTIHRSTLNEKINLRHSETGNFLTTMPLSKFNVEFKLLKGRDELYLTQLMSNKNKGNAPESSLTDQYKRMIVSIEGQQNREAINRYVNVMPARDSRHLRACYKLANPDVKVTENFNCPSCGHEEEVEVPFGADFFWPDR